MRRLVGDVQAADRSSANMWMDRDGEKGPQAAGYRVVACDIRR